MMLKTLKIAAATLIFAAGTASAATFSFLENSADSPSKVFSADGISLTVTSGTFGDADGSAIDFSERLVDQSKTRGLGSDSSADNSRTIDGKFGNDVLVLTFDRLVTLSSLNLGKIDSKDKYVIGTVNSGNFDFLADNQVATSFVDVTNLYGSITGTTFAIGAIGNKHNFTVEGLTVAQPSLVQISRAVSVAPVPLPASSLLLIAGIGGLVAAQRKSRKS